MRRAEFDRLSRYLEGACLELSQLMFGAGLRHSFATAFLEAGGSIHKLQQLLGHTSLETTEIYTHCVAKFAADVVSPLDVVPSNVVPFSSGGETGVAAPGYRRVVG